MSTTTLYRHEPDYAVAPGRTLQETIDALGMDQNELAIRTGLDKKTINQIIGGKHPLTQQTAIKLERATGVPARIWNKLEMQYQERLARQKDSARLTEDLDWLKKIPVRELLQRGVIQPQADKVSLLREVLAFFGVNNTAEWEEYWTEGFACRFRRSKAFEMKPGATATWIRIGELQTQKIACNPYDKDRFLAVLKELRGLTVAPVAQWQPRLVALCADAGVAVVLVPEIGGCPVSGLARWLTPEKAIIQLCLRHKTDDHFWFTFFHEAGHILKDPKKEVFIEDGNEGDEAEERANQFSTDFLIPPSQAKQLPTLRSKTSVAAFAQSLGIAAGIVVGQMQKRGIIPYSFLNDLKQKLMWGGEKS